MVGEAEESEPLVLPEVPEELPEPEVEEPDELPEPEEPEELRESEEPDELLGRLEEVLDEVLEEEPDEELEDLSLLKQAVMLSIIAIASRTVVVRVSFIRFTPINKLVMPGMAWSFTHKKWKAAFALYRPARQSRKTAAKTPVSTARQSLSACAGDRADTRANDPLQMILFYHFFAGKQRRQKLPFVPLLVCAVRIPDMWRKIKLLAHWHFGIRTF